MKDYINHPPKRRHDDKQIPKAMGSYCHDAHRLYVRHVNSSMDGLTMNKHKHAELIKQWADGATIQMLLSVDDGFADCANPQWLNGVVYRVKPELKSGLQNIHWLHPSILVIIHRTQTTTTYLLM